MTESTEPHPEKQKNWVGALLKTVFFTVAFFLLIFTVLANMGGTSDTLKGAVEDFLTDLTGYQSGIGTLNRMSFFPVISIDIEDIELQHKGGTHDPVITIGRIYFAMGFWDVSFRTGKIRAFTIENMSALPGVLLSHPLYMERVSIEEDQGDLAFFEGHGKIGPHTVSFQADMVASGLSERRKYRFSEERPFTLAAGDIGLEGELFHTGNKLEVRKMILTVPEKMAEGNLIFAATGEGKTRIKGSISTDSGSVISPDFVLYRDETQRHLEGKIESETLHAADLSAQGKPAQAFKKLRDILGWPVNEDGSTDLSGINLDLDVDVADLVENGAGKGLLATKVTIKDGKTDWGALGPYTGK